MNKDVRKCYTIVFFHVFSWMLVLGSNCYRVKTRLFIVGPRARKCVKHLFPKKNRHHKWDSGWNCTLFRDLYSFNLAHHSFFHIFPIYFPLRSWGYFCTPRPGLFTNSASLLQCARTAPLECLHVKKISWENHSKDFLEQMFAITAITIIHQLEKALEICREFIYIGLVK